jgi:hypothetical protein
MVKSAPNKDVLVPDEMTNEFPLLKELLSNPELETEFRLRDQAANRSKKIFNALGLLSLTFIVVVLLITTWRFFLGGLGLHVPAPLITTAAILALLSFVLAIASHVFWRGQEHWLKNRFIAERLRQWKFQQLLDGPFLMLTRTDSTRFRSELKSRWIRERFNLLETPGTMEDFLNAENFELFVTPSVCSDGALAQQVFDAYLSLRLEYQAKYFSSKKASLVVLDTWSNGLAKLALVIAGLLAFAEVGVLLLQSAGHESTLAFVMGASALSAALISATIRVLRSARAVSEETERYTSKWLVLKLVLESQDWRRWLKPSVLQLRN